MSKQIEAKLTCPNCHHQFSFTLYRTIWGEYPDNRELVMSDSINVATCPFCKTTSKLDFSFFYTNQPQHFAVWWEPEYDSQIDTDSQGYARMLGADSYLANAPRIKDWNEFKDTILKFETGELEGEAEAKTEETQNLMEGFVEYLKEEQKENTERPDIIKEFERLNVRGEMNLSKLKDFLKQGLDVNSRNSVERTPLMSCSEDPESIKLLLEAGADPNLQDTYGLTALHLLSSRGAPSSLESIRLLLNSEADPNLRQKDGMTALVQLCAMSQNSGLAASRGSDSKLKVDVCRLLLELGADPNIQDKEGNTALMHLCLMHTLGFNDYKDINNPLVKLCEVLLSLGADPNVKNGQGQTAFMLLIARKSDEIKPKVYFDVLDYLLSSGADFDIANVTSVLVATWDQDDKYGRNFVKAVLRRLLASGAEPDPDTRRILKLNKYSPSEEKLSEIKCYMRENLHSIIREHRHIKTSNECLLHYQKQWSRSSDDPVVELAESLYPYWSEDECSGLSKSRDMSWYKLNGSRYEISAFGCSKASIRKVLIRVLSEVLEEEREIERKSIENNLRFCKGKDGFSPRFIVITIFSAVFFSLLFGVFFSVFIKGDISPALLGIYCGVFVGSGLPIAWLTLMDHKEIKGRQTDEEICHLRYIWFKFLVLRRNKEEFLKEEIPFPDTIVRPRVGESRSFNK